MAMTDPQEKWKSTKVVLRVDARCCRNHLMDAPCSEDEKAIGLESRFVVLARMLWHRDRRVLVLLYQQWEGATELLEPDDQGFCAKDPVLMEARFHEGMDHGLRRRLQRANHDVAAATGKKKSAERRIRMGIQRQAAMWKPRRSGMRLLAVRRPMQLGGVVAQESTSDPAEMHELVAWGVAWGCFETPIECAPCCGVVST